ncbi:MAG: CPBP family intramembrane glutamic endopeptidase [Clostridiaceae bacterium]|nr:CPBP family intramembrane metalloprotease [Eubacteriales bacterium]
MKKFFLAILKAACYTLLFFLLQVLVVAAAGVVFAVQQGFEFAMDGGSFDAFALAGQGADFVLQNANLITIVSSAAALFFLWPVFAVQRKKYALEVSLLPARPALAPAAAILLGLSFAFVLSIVLDLLPIPESMWEEYEQYSSTLADQSHPLIAFLATVLVAPVTEEIFFRGLVYTRLKRGMPTAVALLVESAIFGLLHGAAIWMAYAFLLGVLMTLLYEKFGTVLVSMAFHAAFNLAGGYLVTRVDTESGVVYWAALAIAAAVSVASAAWIVSMPKYRAPLAQGGE